MALRVARLLHLLLTALATGVFFGTRASLSPSVRSFPAPVYTRVQQATIRNLYPVMGVVLPGAVLATIAVLFLLPRRRSPAFALTALSLLGQVIEGASTRRYNFPINAYVQSWTPDAPPADWEAARDRWEQAHTRRTVLAVGSLTAAVLAVLVDTPVVVRTDDEARCL